MSWENINLTIDNFISSQYLRNNWFDYPANREENDIYIPGTNLKDIAIVDGEYHTIFDNGIFRVDFCANTYPDEYRLQCYYQNTIFIDTSSGGWTSYDYLSLAFGIDSDTDQGQVMFVQHKTDWPSGWYAFYNISSSSTVSLENAYLAITGSIPDPTCGGGAGSGYIGNSLLSNKKMVGYNVPTSSAVSTKTESVEDAKNKATSGKPKIGNGYARITLLQEIIPNPPDEFLQDIDAINGSGYVFKNWQQPASLSYPVSTNTYYSTKSHSFEHYSYFNNNGFYALNDGCTLCMSSIYTVYITKNNDKFTYTLNPDLKAEIYRTDDNKYYRWGQCYSQTKAPYYNNGPVIFGILDDYSPYWGKFVPPYTFTTNNSGTDYSKLHDLFRNLKDHARNVNIFVDGECWALASN